MTAKDVAQKLKDLATFLTKSGAGIPESELRQADSEIAAIRGRLEGFRSPTKEDLKAAVGQSASSQIVQFTGLNQDRKAFFNVQYFKQKLEALPPDRIMVAPFIKKGTVKDYLNALLLYHYCTGRSEGDARLRTFLGQLQSDYNNSPAVRQATEAKAFLKTLLRESDSGAVAAALQAKYPSSAELTAFATLTNLKIPKESKAKSAPKSTAHERLAEQILREGALIRMKLE
ncbi:MAG: hypothetical protein ACLQPD_26900 [Desulfomonilaceae bacterium]